MESVRRRISIVLVDNSTSQRYQVILGDDIFGEILYTVSWEKIIVIALHTFVIKYNPHQVSKPGFKRFAIFSEDLVGVELTKPVVVLDKPIYIGASVLDLSKLHMFNFYYNILREKFPNCSICFSGECPLYRLHYTFKRCAI